jgi:hypothetical protein
MQDHAFGIDEIGISEKVGSCEERSTRTKSLLDKLQLKVTCRFRASATKSA